jgi:glycerol-3-phosphate acyltransferase PlsY
MTPLQLVAVALVAYLIGSVPTGFLVARAFGREDLTRRGSGRTGATNVLRTVGPVAAGIVAAGDILKGALAVYLGGILGSGDPWAQALAALLAVLGHTYSPFLSFKGGRGVLVGVGSLLVVFWPMAVVAVAIGVTLITLTRYVSLGSVVGAAIGGIGVALVALVAEKPAAYLVYGLSVAAFIIVAHRDNIQRLLAGTERKLGERA